MTARTAEYTPFPDVAGRNALQATLEIPALVRLLRLPTGRRMLEIGCGRGVGLVELAHRCRPSRLAGLDISAELLDVARHRLAHAGSVAELHLGDVRALPFADASFDVVVDFGTCYHISRPERALSEIARVLAPGGLFVHETPLAQWMAHPLRTAGRSLPWRAAPSLTSWRWAGLWGVRVKQAGTEALRD
jgi:ubiquinone/menaquinone biosynthesis C-methylase UbiE